MAGDCGWKQEAFNQMRRQVECQQYRLMHYLGGFKDQRLFVIGDLLSPTQQEVVKYKHDSLVNHYTAHIMRAAYEKIKDFESQEQQSSKTTSMYGSQGSDFCEQMNSRKRLSKEQKSVLHQWLKNNWHHPYPSDEDKEKLAKECGISVKRVNHWYINARVRIWRPVTHEAARKAGESGSTDAVASLLQSCKANNVYKKFLNSSST
mmetsp:Transcript_20539/g.29730  ORF Transcript_20539/g.29730 Transcript_20539/m.29730 type:complete len:205 (-) Transcript_20539:68-682(-)